MKFTVDGVEFNAIVTEFSRRAEIRESKLSGDVKSGRYFRDIIGTYYSYEMTIATNSLSRVEYDALYEVLTAPVESHVVRFPYGQDELEYECYIDSVDDMLKRITEDEAEWAELGIEFIAIAPQRRPVT